MWSQSPRKIRRGPSHRRLRLEALEDRCVPTILFTPQFRAESITDGGQRLSSPPVHLILWGSYWRTATNPFVFQVINSLQNVVSSSYLSGLSQYGSNGSASYDGTAVANYDDPPQGFDAPHIQGVISNAIEHQGVSEPDDNGHDTAIYVVVTPPGILSDQGSHVLGYNTGYNTGGFPDNDPAVYVWISIPAGGGDVTGTMSHEIAEAISDPQALGTGIKATHGATWPPQPGEIPVGQIGDYEAENYTYRLDNGALVQSEVPQGSWTRG